MTNDLAAAAERLRRDKAGDSSAYDEFTLPCTRRLDDRRTVADAYLAREAELAAWTDPTPLTLDVLRRDDVLGEPRANSRAGVRWVTPSGQFVVWLSHYDNAMVGEMIVETIGQLRRILSVIEETTPGGGDAAK